MLNSDPFEGCLTSTHNNNCFFKYLARKYFKVSEASCIYYLRRRLASECIVTLGVMLSCCVCVRRISLGDEGNGLYPVFCIVIYLCIHIIKRPLIIFTYGKVTDFFTWLPSDSLHTYNFYCKWLMFALKHLGTSLLLMSEAQKLCEQWASLIYLSTDLSLNWSKRCRWSGNLP